MSKPLTQKYRTTNWSSYNESLCQRGSLMLWIDKDMSWVGELNGKWGRSPSFSDAAIQFCLMIKNLYGQALRQAKGMVRSQLNLAGLDWDVPDFSTLLCDEKQREAWVSPFAYFRAGMMYFR